MTRREQGTRFTITNLINHFVFLLKLFFIKYVKYNANLQLPTALYYISSIWYYCVVHIRLESLLLNMKIVEKTLGICFGRLSKS